MIKTGESKMIRFYLAIILTVMVSVSASACKDKNSDTSVILSVRAVDGDSLETDKRRIRLEGIDAPEYKQPCWDENGQEYRCGIESLEYLKSLMKNRKISCQCEAEKDRYKRELCVCFADNLELNKQMVLAGYAVDYRSQKYAGAEKTARESQSGIWRGKFMRPSLYRSLERDKEQKWCKANPAECKARKKQKKIRQKMFRKKHRSGKTGKNL